MSTTSESTVTIAQYTAVLERAASDPAFRAELLSAPAATLESAGVSIPSNGNVKVVEDTQQLRYVIVSARPSGLSDSDLAQVTAETLPSPDSVASDIASYAQVVADSWTNSALRSQLLSNPAAALASKGIQVPSGVSLTAIEASENELVVAIPPASTTTSSSSTQSIGELASSITSSFTNLTKLITAGSYLAGLGFSVGAIMKFKQHKDNPTQVPIGTPVALVYIAAALLFLPSILSTD
jgi:hypothetical protein